MQSMLARDAARLTGAVIMAITLICSTQAAASSNTRIVATGGATTIEGSAGGGIVPWAVLSGYADERQMGGAVGFGHVSVKDFSLDTLSASFNWNNRLELSVTRQSFDIGSIAAGEKLEQNIFGAKIRLSGDLIYTRLPQFTLGAQYKRNTRFDVPRSVNAVDDSDVDIYLAASKLWLNGPLNRSLFINATLRATRANQIGLLGFGGDANRHHEPMLELSAGLFLNRHWVLGTEYRQKPDNLSLIREDDWQDVFVGWFPNKRVSVVMAWTGLGSIAGFDHQNGYYLSVQISQ